MLALIDHVSHPAKEAALRLPQDACLSIRDYKLCFEDLIEKNFLATGDIENWEYRSVLKPGAAFAYEENSGQETHRGRGESRWVLPL